MPAKSTKRGGTPTLCTRPSPATGKPLAYATFDGKFVSFGPAGPEAQRRYDEFLARWLANGRQLEPEVGDREAYLVEDLVADFLDHARTYYVQADGSQSGEYDNVRLAMVPVLRLLRDLPADEFGPVALRAVRQTMIDSGRLCRKEINKRVHRIRMAWRWAACMEKVPGSVVEALRTVDGLRAGRTQARESKPVRPVEDATVTEVTAQLCPTMAAMVWFAYWTGSRPGEVCSLRWSMIDRSGPVWIARLEQHKTAWRGRARCIAVGPRAQEALMPFLRPGPDCFVFQPKLALQEQRAAKATARRSPVPQSQRRRAEQAHARPKEQIADHYDVGAFRRAIARGVRAANAARIRRQIGAALREAGNSANERLLERVERLSVAALTDDAGQLKLREGSLRPLFGKDFDAVADSCKQVALVENWAPNRLRHSAATRLRRHEGLEAARVILGHTRAAVTEIYAEIDHAKSLDIMRRLG